MTLLQITAISIPIFSFYGYCIALSNRGVTSLSSAPIVTTSLLIIVTFLFAIIGVLYQAVFALEVIGLILFAAAIFDIAKMDERYKSVGKYLPILVHLFLSSTLACLLYKNNSQIWYWDDFTHWAIVSRDIFNFDTLPTPANGSSFFAYYPPGAALFQYYFLFPFKWVGHGGYHESVALFGQGFIIISAIIPLLTFAIRKSIPLAVGIFFIFFYLNFNSTDGFLTLMIDTLIGFYLSACLVSIVIDDEKGQLVVPLVCAVAISLLKATGIFFTFAILCIAFANAAYLKISSQRPDNPSQYKYSWGQILMVFSVAALFAAILRELWLGYILNLSIGPVFGNGITLHGLMTSITNPNDTQSEILHTFIQFLLPNIEGSAVDLLKSVTNNPFRYYLYGILSLTIITVLLHKDKKRISLVAIFLYAFFVVYCIILLMSYMLLFSADEGLRLASIGRYLGSFTTGLVIFLCALIIRLEPKYSTLSVSVVFVALIPLVVNPIIIIRAQNFIGIRNDNNYELTKTRSKYAELLSEHSYLKDSRSRILVVSECTDEYDKLILSYDLFPAKVVRLPQLTPDCNSTKNLTTSSAYFDRIKFDEFDYLVIINSSSWFKNSYGYLFDKYEVLYPSLYTVNVRDDKPHFIRVVKSDEPKVY